MIMDTKLRGAIAARQDLGFVRYQDAVFMEEDLLIGSSMIPYGNIHKFRQHRAEGSSGHALV
jgi:hypothetical protein